MTVISKLVITKSFKNKYLLINIKNFADCYSVKVLGFLYHLMKYI